MGMDEAKMIEPCSITTAEWVRMKCEFGCPRFGMSFCCPPYVPSPEVTRKVIDAYESAILLYQKLENGERREERREERRKAFNESIVRLEIEIFLDGYYKAWSMGSGYCHFCKNCDPTGFCRHGFEARPATEACGIDVFKTARDNGFHVDVVRTPENEVNILGVGLVSTPGRVETPPFEAERNFAKWSK